MPRLPPHSGGNVGNLEASFYVKVLIHIYIWKGCQGCQLLSLAALLAALTIYPKKPAPSRGRFLFRHHDAELSHNQTTGTLNVRQYYDLSEPANSGGKTFA
jgi:hypothetical protein